MNRELSRILALSDVKERLSRDGVEPAASTPEHLRDVVRNEKTMWQKVIREANIKVR